MIPRTVLAACAVLCAGPFILARADEARPLYLDPTAPIEARLDDLLPRLTLEEKVALVHADTKFTSPGVPRLGIPKIWMSDGPHGVREEIRADTWHTAGRTDDFSTYLPVSIALASTWNPDLAHAYGETIAAEARARGKDIMLGPGMNIMRTPLCGRNFEYYGEDPWLASRIAVGDILGMQSGDTAACAKHFALNNQEVKRNSIDVEVDERALREIYLPAFEASVREAGVLTVMGAYNKFRGQHACHNEYLLNDILKGEWGFTGLVVSDWNGTHDTREAALCGLDLEMGTSKPSYDDYYLARPFREAIERGEIPVAVLDDKVRRILRVFIAMRGLDGRRPGAINTPAHHDVARHVAEEAIVLLKNERRALPLDLGTAKTIAVIGENAIRLQAHGGQSSELKTLYEITPLEGIVRRVGTQGNVIFSHGYKAPVPRRRSQYDPTGAASFDGLEPAIADPEAMIVQAVAAASQADVAIIIAGLNHDAPHDTESSDRTSLDLPWGQPELIARVAAANPNTIVVMMSGSPVAMDPWIANVPAVVQAWYPGMEGGIALARVLFGDVNPTGKLPCTFPRKLADSPAHASGDARHYPGVDGKVFYDEGLLVGYRWFDAKAIEPLFPFGHGLSYTTFSYANLKVAASSGDAVAVATVDITNTGERAGSEVVQLYVHDDDASVPRPLRELKGFAKVALEPGEMKTVSIPLGQRAFAFYAPDEKAWVAEAGTFTISVGASSRDLRQSGPFTLGETLRSH